MATHSSILAWKIPRGEEPGRLQSMGSQRVRHDWACMHRYIAHDRYISLWHQQRTWYTVQCSLYKPLVKWSEVKSLSRVWLCNPMDYSLPRSSIHGIFQARVLEWIAISFSRGPSQSQRPKDNLGLLDCRQTLYCLIEAPRGQRQYIMFSSLMPRNISLNTKYILINKSNY